MLSPAFPLLMSGMRVGLMGGTYDPIHRGHLYFAKKALQAFNLHKVILLLSNNPCKGATSQSLITRFQHIKKSLCRYPKIDVGLAPKIFSLDTMVFLKKRYSQVRFMWLMGADSLVDFHLWHQWKKAMKQMPMLIFPRKDFIHKVRHCRAASSFHVPILPYHCYSKIESHHKRFRLFSLTDSSIQEISSTSLRNNISK